VSPQSLQWWYLEIRPLALAKSMEAISQSIRAKMSSQKIQKNNATYLICTTRLAGTLIGLGVVLLFLLPSAHAQDSTAAIGIKSIAIGRITDSTVTIGISESDLQAALRTSGNQQANILRKIAADLNASVRSMLSGPASAHGTFNSTLVHGFLASVTGRQVPESEWRTVFNELATAYLRIGLSISEVGQTDSQVSSLVRSANEAYRAGKLQAADQLLEDAEKLAIAQIAQKNDHLLAVKRDATNLLSSRAEIAISLSDRVGAAKLLERAHELQKDTKSTEAHRLLVRAGDEWIKSGNTEQGRVVLERAIAYVTAVMKSGILGDNIPPERAKMWDISVSLNLLSLDDIAGLAGNVTAQIAIRRRLLEIAEHGFIDRNRSYSADVRHAVDQYESLADALLKDDKDEEALRMYQVALARLDSLKSSGFSEPDRVKKSGILFAIATITSDGRTNEVRIEALKAAVKLIEEIDENYFKFNSLFRRVAIYKKAIDILTMEGETKRPVQ
jgi:tetratricopeptide (TPR) repeat protein